MCRMVGVIARVEVPIRPFLEALGRQSLHGVQAPHADGYGLAVLTAGHWLHVREQCPVWEAPLDSLSSLRGTAMLLHSRKASDPSTINLTKLHPFFCASHGPGIMFCQNGTIRHHERLTDLAPPSAIDTEKYFNLVIRHFGERPDLALSIREAADEIDAAGADPTSLNALASDGHVLVAYKGRVLPENEMYHTLHVCDGRDVSVVSTEPFDLAPGLAWQQLDGICTRAFT